MATVIELGLEKVEMRRELLLDARLQRRGGVAQPRGVELEEDWRHRAALGKVEQFAMADMGVGARRRDEVGAAMALTQMLDDRPRFHDDAAIIFEQRRFAERVNGTQFGRREVGDGIALIMADRIRRAELLEQPEDALRTTVVDVVDNQGQWRGSPVAG